MQEGGGCYRQQGHLTVAVSPGGIVGVGQEERGRAGSGAVGKAGNASSGTGERARSPRVVVRNPLWALFVGRSNQETEGNDGSSSGISGMQGLGFGLRFGSGSSNSSSSDSSMNGLGFGGRRCDSREREAMAREMGMDERAASLIIAVAEKYSALMAPNMRIQANFLTPSSQLLCGQNSSPIPIHQYIARVVRALNEVYDRHDPDRAGIHGTGIQIMILATIYIDRLLMTQRDFMVHYLNIHRLFFSGIVAAIKFSEDSVPDKKLMSMIGGMDAVQVRVCEIRFCSMVKFRFWVDPVTELQRQFDYFCLPMNFQYTVPVLN